MSRDLLNVATIRAQAPPIDGWDALTFILRVVSHGYAKWAQRGPVRGRPVEEPAARLRRVRGGR